MDLERLEMVRGVLRGNVYEVACSPAVNPNSCFISWRFTCIQIVSIFLTNPILSFD